MQPPTGPQPTPNPSPSNTPPSPDPRGEDFDISTLPTSDASTGNKKWIPTQWNRTWLAVAGLLALYCLWLFAFGLGARSQKPLPLPINTPSATAATVPTVTVHIAGAVARPGVYTVSSNARISDAITQAGGLTPDAETTSLNLADYVRDGAQIVVPSRTTTNTTTGSPTDTSPNGLPATSPTTSPEAAAREAQIAHLRAHPIDLNRATSFELQQLPGIGPSRADEIIAYRNANGLFRSVSDLDNVKGIGEKRMEVLKDLVVVR